MTKSADVNTDVGQETAAALDLARGLLRDSREELSRADEKAGSLLTAVGVAVGLLLTGAIGGVWSPATFGQGARLAWWFGVAATGAAVCCLVSALLPRFLAARDTARVSYFAQVVHLEQQKKGAGEDHLRAAVTSAAADPLAHTLDQVRAISSLASVKYRRIRAAITAMALAAVALGIALALQTPAPHAASSRMQAVSQYSASMPHNRRQRCGAFAPPGSLLQNAGRTACRRCRVTYCFPPDPTESCSRTPASPV
ncbi:MAG: Pycsar system effector family protein [Egibacteraceae bacterium]